MESLTNSKVVKVIHKADTRGLASHGWLTSRHTFSFSSYYEPSRMSFGALRVLNDDIVAPGMGFGMHPHDNMEIISIPLSGTLEHKDTMGTVSVIKAGDVQIMSAGSGVMHSEYNQSRSEYVNFLQIWVLPKQKNIEPRYDQRYFSEEEKKNKLKLIVSPDKSDDALLINQDAFFYLGEFDGGQKVNFKPALKGEGAYFFLLNGEAEIEGEILSRRDGLGLAHFENTLISFTQPSQLLIMEVPVK